MQKLTLVAFVAAIACSEAGAHEITESKDSLGRVQLHEVTVGAKLRHLNEAVRLDLKTTPVQSSQQVLRVVPGLFIAQHAGGGKAEQMFLRGFDLDHGTDISVSVDGMPVNMLSHAHGQGYADLHFLMPELIDMVDFDKGPYDVARGDLATAGYVEFKTRDRVPTEAGIEVGMHNYQRYRASASFLDSDTQSFYAAASFLTDDGFFDAGQNFKRFNAMTKYTHWGAASKFSVTASHFNSTWNASGQIPERAVEQGTIGWFGSLDPSEGGSTSRTSVQAMHHLHMPDGASLNTSIWTSYYTFDLYSNFTFYLNDRDRGDEIHQHERRLLSGAQTSYTLPVAVGADEWQLSAGAGFRYDAVRGLGLYHAQKRHDLGTLSFGDVDESSLFAYAGMEMKIADKLILYPGVRVDWFKMAYRDRMKEEAEAEFDSRSRSQAKLSPKFSAVYMPSDELEIVAKFGRGFHSNDARVVVVEENGRQTLPGVTAVDLGLKYKPLPGMLLNLTGWYMHSEQEFVYVGDEAIVEPSGRSRRLGVDVGLRYNFARDFFFRSDYTWCHARSIDEPRGDDYIPLAPVHTLTAGLTWKKSGFNIGINGRWLSRRPANEDYSIAARAYFIVDFNAAYTYRRMTVGAAIDNIFDSKWREAQFATETLLPGETEPHTDICFTPGTPFSLRGYVSFRF
ncbi:MAG: TonB-dependent receptor [Muribaculaceae bacterium]|nr:TonB-dependent receptor [Muribaculaceae bacterium]